MKMRVLLGLLLIPYSTALAQPAQEDRAVAIGPWQVEVNYEAGKFDHCTMSRTTESGVETRFTREDDGLMLMMSSPRWQLEQGKTYPVELVAGSSQWAASMDATSDAVEVLLTDSAFNENLRTADLLEVRAAGSIIEIPLDRSAAALERLESCYETNSQATEANPFVAPPRTP